MGAVLSVNTAGETLGPMGIIGPAYRGHSLGGLMKIFSARLFVGGVAALALLLPGVGPSWAAEEPATVTGVVYLDGKPTGDINVCDSFHTDVCDTTAADGTYSVKTLRFEYETSSGTEYRRCLAVAPGPSLKGVFPAIDRAPRAYELCELSIEAAPGETVTKIIHVTSFPKSWGQVVNSAGRPIAGAEVGSGRGREVSLTDANGRFSVRMGPYLYDEHYLEIKAKGYESRWARFSPDGALGKIVLPAAGVTDVHSISGRVVDAAGRPYVGAVVCLEGNCLGSVNSDGTYSGLIPSDVAGQESFEIELPGVSRPVAMKSEYSGFQTNFVTNVDFKMSSRRSLVAGALRIRGAAKVGKRLSVKVGTWLPRPVTTTCRWYVGSKVVKRSCSSLKVKASYRGKRIRVKVTGSRAGYGSLTVASRATVRVYR